MKNILWIYYKPLIPEAGGTERITDLVMRGLAPHGFNTMGMLVMDIRNDLITYNSQPVDDLYSFLQHHSVDVVVNQQGQVPPFLKYFLNQGGERWQSEGGVIISCLHFDPKPISRLQDISVKRKKGFHDYIGILKARLLYKRYERQDLESRGRDMKWVYEHSNHYILLSERFLPCFKEAVKLPDYSKLHCINNPLTFQDILDDNSLPQKENIILVCSRMYERQKRISLVLKIWRRLHKLAELRQWKLVIIGEGEDIDRYKEYAKRHKLERIEFVGQQCPEAYYEKAKIFLMTSIMEGWGLTLTESLQNGVVPIAFDTCAAFHDIIEDGVNGYIIPEGDMKGYQKSLLKIIHDDALWNKMALAALSSAERFRIENISEQWVKLITSES